MVPQLSRLEKRDLSSFAPADAGVLMVRQETHRRHLFLRNHESQKHTRSGAKRCAPLRDEASFQSAVP